MAFKPDGCFCWLQAFFACFLHIVTYGLSYCFGIFYVAMLEDFPNQESKTAWILGLNLSLIMLATPITLWMLIRIPSPIVCCMGTLLAALALFLASKASSMIALYATFGVMHGLASNLIYITAIYVIRKNFRKHLDLAMGIGCAGTGVGGILFGTVLPPLVGSRGWRDTLMITSGITLGFTVFGVFMFPVCPKIEKETKRENKALPCLHCLSFGVKKEETTVGEVEKQSLMSRNTRCKRRMRLSESSPWRNPSFAVICITYLLYYFVNPVPYCHIVNYAIHQGVSRSQGDRLPLAIAISSFLGRISVGKIADYRRLSRVTLFQIALLIQCLAITLCTLATSIAGLATYAAVFGMFDGWTAVLLVLVTNDLFLDKQEALKSLGPMFQLLAIPSCVGAPFAGWFYELTGSYHVAFFICGGALFIAACLVSLARYFLPPELETSIFEKIVISSEDNKSENQTPDEEPAVNGTIISRPHSLLDMAIDIFGKDNRNKGQSYALSTSALQVHTGNHGGTGNNHESEACFLGHPENRAEITDFSTEVSEKYTDITSQISGTPR